MERLLGATRICVAFFCVLQAAWCCGQGTNTTAILNSILRDYDRRLRPNDTGSPVSVKINVYIESMEGIRESTMDFAITMYFRMFWRDPRLSFEGNQTIIFKSGDMDNLWIPDVVFLYEKQAKVHTVTQINRLLRVQPDGNVASSSRVSATLSCNMMLQQFPMDRQKCTIVMSSYAYSTRDVILYVEEGSIQIEPGITIPKFSLTGSEFSNEEAIYLLGNYSTPKFHFYFMRQTESYFLTVYIPTMVLVSIAWLSFWIDAKAAPARVALGITTVLTVTTMTAGIQETLPVVTYAKAIDIWLAVCLLFVFFSLLEFGMANYLLVVQTRREKSLAGDIEQSPAKEMERNLQIETVGDGGRCCSSLWTANRLDCVARWAYPAAFLVFNAFYWIYFLAFNKANAKQH
ncbi:glycine receptor subunit alpha-2-like [Acanthaster planci]|uniref:Gamma-aminobutyric acid receptor subunit beta n=1 Tax=Acanthaster planci TaxID=133434 RepID=A0A8B7ZID8_ACAPL|nr:glycine receptor subunit alpha-2-like [Acanthaster planci]